MSIPVIDLFAGPGGLGEGFSSVFDKKGERVFSIKLSIEKDEHAHETLRLRSFFRQFKPGKAPRVYYDYIKENNKKKKEEYLALLQSDFSMEWNNASKEACKIELPYPEETKVKDGREYKIGYTHSEIEERHKEIDQKIIAALPKHKNFLLIGGPPCQAYSLVGRARNQGISNADHRVHLYKEYLRIIAKHHPAVFVMENVKGLLSAKVEGKKVFSMIKDDLTDPGSIFPHLNSPNYRIYSFVKQPDGYDANGFPIYKDDRDFLIKTEKYGIPQKRHRVILLGIREDIKFDKLEPLERSKEVSLKKVISSLPKIRSGISREIIGTNAKGNHVYKAIENNSKEWRKAVKNYLQKLDNDVSGDFNDFINTELQGDNYIEINLNENKNPLYDQWYRDDRLGGVLNHECRTHLKEDLGRYLFSALYLRAKGDFPRLSNYPEWLLPDHKNAKGGKFADRFRTQRPNQPATTVTSHISKDGHYFIHYDPSQCRSLTVREAARIQTFPDNYYFCGSRTHQYHQVGNAVPPYLASQLAKIVKDIFYE